MTTLILYISRHGCTEKAAFMLEELIDGEVTVEDLKKRPNIDITEFDAIIIGGSIHAGRIQKKIKSFLKNNRDELLKKKLGLFICHMDKEKAQEEFDHAFPAELREHASAQGLFGGEFIFEKMNFLEKMIVKKVAGVEKSVYEINEEAIEEFAEKFSNKKS